MLAYFSLMLWYLQLTYSRILRMVYALCFIGLGIGIEFMQAAGGVRQFDWFDALANAIGVVIAIGISYTKAETWLKAFEVRVGFSSVN